MNYKSKYLNHYSGNDSMNHNLQSNIFYTKYIKYKKKYLELKKLIGGENTNHKKSRRGEIKKNNTNWIMFVHSSILSNGRAYWLTDQPAG